MKYSRQNELGVAHLLALVVIVALVGVLGFLGYNAWNKQQVEAGGKSTVGKKVAYNRSKPQTFHYDKYGLCQADGYLYIKDTAKKNDTSILTVTFDRITPFTYQLEYHLDKKKAFAKESQNYLGAPRFVQTSMKAGTHYFKTGIAGKKMTFTSLRTGAKHWSVIFKDKDMTSVPQCANIKFAAGSLSVCKYQNVVYVKRVQQPGDTARDSTAKLGFRFDGKMWSVNNLFELSPGTQYFSSPVHGKQLELIRTVNDIYARKFGAQDLIYAKAIDKIAGCKF